MSLNSILQSIAKKAQLAILRINMLFKMRKRNHANYITVKILVRVFTIWVIKLLSDSK